MYGHRAVVIPTLASRSSRQRFSFAVMPRMQLAVRVSTACVSVVMESKKKIVKNNRFKSV